MKVIFLDFDGVLINRESFTSRMRVDGFNGAAAHPQCMAELNRIVAETGACVVVSSTHRSGKVIDMREKLAAWGFAGKVIGETPIMRGSPRGIEIQAWIDRHKGTRYEPSVFAIVDDDSDMEHLAEHLVLTAFESGLRQADADRVVGLLNRRAA